MVRTRLEAISGVLLLLSGTALPIGAQQNRAETAHTCLDTISASAFVRVPVYLEAKAADSSARALLPDADSLAIRVGAMVRSSLGEPGTSLPEGELLLQWRQVGGSVRIVAHRDGHFTWPTASSSSVDTSHAPGRLLLVSALASLRDAGARIGWPASVPGDSATFDLAYRWADVAPDGTIQPLLVRMAAMPMFSMAMPRSTQVVQRRPPHITYPQESRAAFTQGELILQFVVDTSGRVQTNTIHDKWPADLPRLSGWKAEHYQSFLNAVKWGLSSARYDPATIGGCKVLQVVEQPFSFTLSH